MSRHQDYRGKLVEPGTIGDEHVEAIERCMDTMDLWCVASWARVMECLLRARPRWPSRVTFYAAFSDSASPRRATTLPSDHIPLRRYGNALVFVFMMTDVPPGSRTYKSRGWCGARETIALPRAHLTLSVGHARRCNMEYRVAGLLTPSHMCLDLAVLHEDMTKYDNKNTMGWENSLWFWEGDDAPFTTIGKHCGSTRDPPLPAESFHEMMDEKTEDGSPKIKFSFEGDRTLIIGLYTKTYTAVVACAVDFDWKGLGWSCDMSMLMPVLLAAASTLKKLNISHNAVEGAPRVVHDSVAPRGIHSPMLLLRPVRSRDAQESCRHRSASSRA